MGFWFSLPDTYELENVTGVLSKGNISVGLKKESSNLQENKELRWNPLLGKLNNFQWTKTLYQNNFKYIAFFFTLFKGHKCNKLYEITAKNWKSSYWSLRKQTSQKIMFSQGLRKKFSLMLLRITNYCTSIGLEMCKKKNAIWLKIFWYKVFVHWKWKLLDFLMYSVLMHLWLIRKERAEGASYLAGGLKIRKVEHLETLFPVESVSQKRLVQSQFVIIIALCNTCLNLQ